VLSSLCCSWQQHLSSFTAWQHAAADPNRLELAVLLQLLQLVVVVAMVAERLLVSTMLQLSLLAALSCPPLNQSAGQCC
jgi:hypothetical protein